MAARRQGQRAALGSNPFSAADAYLDAPATSPRSQRPAGTLASVRTSEDDAAATRRGRKVRGTFQMDQDLLRTARNTVVALSGPPHRLTLAGLVEEAILREIRRLEQEHNDGKPFPPMLQPLRQGRPIGS